MNVMPIGMSVPEAISTLQAPSMGAGASSSATSVDFSAMFDKAIGGLNGSLLKAETGLQGLATGDAKSIHEVMINIAGAKLDFQLAMQIRSRVLDAYQDLMRTQI
jgi:flagellar hook-basal body complex protein FliE